MTSVEVDIRELKKLDRRLNKYPDAMDAAKEELLGRYGNELLQTTVRMASGRPGPRVITGQYVSNFMLEIMPETRRVVNRSPQARRLEYGFVGTDSLGRNYNQPPYPHFRPALILVGEKFKKEFPSMLQRVWRSLK